MGLLDEFKVCVDCMFSDKEYVSGLYDLRVKHVQSSYAIKYHGYYIAYYIKDNPYYNIITRHQSVDYNDDVHTMLKSLPNIDWGDVKKHYNFMSNRNILIGFSKFDTLMIKEGLFNKGIPKNIIDKLHLKYS